MNKLIIANFRMVVRYKLGIFLSSIFFIILLNNVFLHNRLVFANSNNDSNYIPNVNDENYRYYREKLREKYKGNGYNKAESQYDAKKIHKILKQHEQEIIKIDRDKNIEYGYQYYSPRKKYPERVKTKKEVSQYRGNYSAKWLKLAQDKYKFKNNNYLTISVEYAFMSFDSSKINNIVFPDGLSFNKDSTAEGSTSSVTRLVSIFDANQKLDLGSGLKDPSKLSNFNVAASIAFGKIFTKFWSVELEFLQQNVEIDDINAPQFSQLVDYDIKDEAGEIESAGQFDLGSNLSANKLELNMYVHNLFINNIFNFKIASFSKFYELVDVIIGGGGGLSLYQDYDNKWKMVPAFSLKTGVRMFVNKNINLFLGYRYYQSLGKFKLLPSSEYKDVESTDSSGNVTKDIEFINKRIGLEIESSMRSHILGVGMQILW